MDPLGVIMYWNYRIVKKLYGQRDENGKLVDPDSEYNEYNYGIHEVFYDHNGKAVMCTVDAISLVGEMPDELIIEMMSIFEAFSKPILDYDSIPEEGSYNEIEEQRNRLLDEDGEMMPQEELIEKGLVTTHEDIRKQLGLEDFDMKEYRNEQAVEQQKSEKEYSRKYVNKELPEVIQTALLDYINNLYTDYGKEEDDNE